VLREPWRVQFVSKAIVPPFRDGTKCLVRDLCLELEGFEPHVLGAGSLGGELGPDAKVHHVYVGAGSYAPTLLSNLGAFAWLLANEAPDLYHFVFSPNPRTSAALRLLGAWSGVPCLQTVASAPRSFDQPDRLFCGDVVVAQSEHTARRIRHAFQGAELEAPVLEVIPPPAPVLGEELHQRTAEVRAALGLGLDGPLFVYPGDLEVSSGAAFVLDLAASADGELGQAVFALAYRRKTPQAEQRRAELEARASEHRVRFCAEVDDMHALLAAATAVVFPVDDLYGKVDLPIVLLEALSLGVPVVVLDQGPLSELQGASRLGGEPRAWLELLGSLAQNSALRAELGARGPLAVGKYYARAEVAARYAALYRRLLLPAGRC